MSNVIEMNDIRQWETVVSVKKDSNIEICGSILQPMKGSKWLIIGYPFNLQREMMFCLVEYDEDMNPPTGIISYVVSKEELEENFEIVGKYEEKYQLINLAFQ